MVDSVANFNTQKTKVGVLTPPDEKFYVLQTNDPELTRRFKKLNNDIYETEKAANYYDQYKTPKGIKGMLIAIGIVASAVLLHKAGLFGKLKNLLHH